MTDPTAVVRCCFMSQSWEGHSGEAAGSVQTKLDIHHHSVGEMVMEDSLKGLNFLDLKQTRGNLAGEQRSHLFCPYWLMNNRFCER